MTPDDASPNQSPAPRWQPVGAIERRVLGVLIEKAKTTPENYPLSLNSIRTACNQKTNRAPLMQLEDDHVDEALESLRKLGAVAQIQGDGRVDKYRHLAYDWLGVEKVELAVMAELLLRGTQTVGELRGRAARMEPIKDLADLEPTLDALRAKGLIVYLTPPGRGSIVTHALYLDREVEKVRREALGEPASEPASAGRPPGPRAPGASAGPTTMPAACAPPTASSQARSPTAVTSQGVAASAPSDAAHLARELQRLQQELTEVRREFLAARAEFESTAHDLRSQLDELNRQLGN
jgi:uncharacterized protein YceH (UPF0502 family)